MALAASLLGAITFNTTAGSKTVVATPTLADMIVVIVAATGVSGALGVSDNNTDGHGSYTLIVSCQKNASADRMSAFVRADPIRKAVSTTWTTSGDGSSTGGGLYVMRITGATLCGPAFIRQSGADNNRASGNPSIALSIGAALTGNALISTVWDTTNAAPGLTVPTGWAALDVNTNYNTPGTGICGTHVNSGETGSTITWNSAPPSASSALAFEMAADTGLDPKVGDQEDLTKTRQTATKRSAFYMQGWRKRRSGLIVPDSGILVPA